MFKAILFDFDGVLTTDKTGSTSIAKYISAHSNIKSEEFKNCYAKYNPDLLSGKYTHKDMWSNLCKDLGVKLDYNLLYESYINTPLDSDMIALIKDLKNKYEIGLVTDNKIDRIHTIIEYFNLSSLFDVISISAEYKSGKDNCDIFAGTVKNLNVKYNECIFIDNNEKNLIIPNELGMKTILFNDEIRNLELFTSL